MKTTKKRVRAKKVKAWAMFLDAYYPVFVGAFEGVSRSKDGDKPPHNHALADMLRRCGQSVFFTECTITYSLPTPASKRSK